MRLLLDTHVLLWAAERSKKLSKSAAELLSSSENDLAFSTASIWEIAVKRGLGRSDFQTEPRSLRRGLLENGYRELTITSEHALATELLPLIHKDPFDRILLAQAIVEEMILLTVDSVLLRYPGPVQRA